MVSLNTYNVKVDLTVQSESEEEARSTVANLINQTSNALGSSSGSAMSTTNTRVAGINKIDCDCKFESEESKEASDKQAKLNKAAYAVAKDLEKQDSFNEVPDEILVKDPDTNTNVIVANPEKKRQLEAKQKEEEKATATTNPQTKKK